MPSRIDGGFALWEKASLQSRLLLLVLISLLPAFGWSIFTAFEYQEREIAQARDRAVETTKLIAYQQESLFNGSRQLLITLARASAIRSASTKECNLFLARLLERYQRYLNFGIADTQGNIVCSAVPPSQPTNIADQVYFRDAYQRRDFAIGEFQLGRLGDGGSLHFGYPLFDENGTVVGIVYAVMDVRWLAKFEAEVASEISEDSILTTMDPRGIVLTRNPDHDKWVGRVATEFPVIQNVLPQKEGVVQITGSDGQVWLYAFSALPDHANLGDAYIVVSTPVNTIFAKAHEVFKNNLVGLGMVTLLLALGTLLGVEGLLMRQIRNLTQAKRQIAKGNFGVRISTTAYGSFELNELIGTFNQMAESLQRREIELNESYDVMLMGWARALDLRDKETEGHTERVAAMTIRLAHAMGVNKDQMIHLRRGALLHDIGKIGIPDEILFKADALNGEQWEIMRQHPKFAKDLLSPATFLYPALDIPYCHHEKWDGTGYPRGLKGEEIPLAARIFAIVDVWDALSSDRPYRAAWKLEKVREYILSQSGKYFDPGVVQLFLTLLNGDIRHNDLETES